MHASGLEGPIPPNISLLKLQPRISDIDGPNQDIPMLRNMTGIVRLVLSNCKISGEIPAYIWTMKNLDMFQIDLSYINLLESSAPPCRDSLLVFITHKLWWEKTTVANVEYEEDEDEAGPAKFYYMENWGFSSTGCFWDVGTTSNDYLATNESILTMDNSQIYASA
ncbi:uncharacterized protein LOC142637296 [Castanea sativa]|uniref:uncharacterized protein LOC142637296 n=1 Tax=Castanea sativa TaxID=21020 RepID=UPI003F651EBF